MAVFEIETPQGTFEVDAPDAETALKVLQGAGAPPAAPEAPQSQAPERGAFQRVDDFMRGAADMVTFGMADEISAKLGEWTGIGGGIDKAGTYDENLAAQRARDATGGLERFGGQVAGSLLLPAARAKTVMGAAGGGAVAGGAYGFGSGEGGFAERAKNAGKDALVGGAAGGLFRAGANALGNRAAAKTIPTKGDLRRVAEEGYDAAERAGVIYRPEAIRELATETVNDLARFGYHPQLQPRVAAVLSEMERLAQGNVTHKGVDVLRRIAASAASSADASERAIASKIIERIDDLMMNPSYRNVLSGDVQAASRGTRQGRENWARMRRAEMVDTAAIKAQRRADSTGTGGNLENALRQNVRGILDNPRRSRGMTPQEISAAERVVSGAKGQDALRLVGRLSPTTGGLSAALNVGAAVTNPMLAIPGAIGMGAKIAADHMTRKNVKRLDQIIRSGGKTAKDLAHLARGGQMDIPQVKRIEALAKMLGTSVPTLAAAVRETAAAH